MDILRGPSSYGMSIFGGKPADPDGTPLPELVIPDSALPLPQRSYSNLYSNKHQALLLRVDHIVEFDKVKAAFNKRRTGMDPLTVSDIVNACLDFVLEHPIPFQSLEKPDDLQRIVTRAVCTAVIARWERGKRPA